MLFSLGGPDKWVVEHLAAPVVRKWVQTTGRTNFVLAKCAFLAGSVVTIGGATLDLSHAWLTVVFFAGGTGFLSGAFWRAALDVEEGMGDGAMSLVTLWSARFLCFGRWEALALAAIGAVTVPLGVPVPVSLGWATLAVGCFAATCVVPPGKSLWERAKDRLRQMRLPSLQPAGNPA